MNKSQKTVLITGASSGIGEALAHEYANKQQSLVLCGRNKDTLTKLKQKCLTLGSPKVELCVIDYLNTKKCIAQLAPFINSIDIAILCAGVSQRALFLDIQDTTVETLFRVNALTPIAIVKKIVNVWKQLDKKNIKKQILVVSSIASSANVPLRSSYCAAKKALEMHIITLKNELLSRQYKQQAKTFVNIELSIVKPGFVRTNVSYNALTAEGETWNSLDTNQKKGISSQKAAQKIIQKICAKKMPSIIYVGMTFSLWMLAFLSQYFPKLAQFILTRVKTA